MIKELPYWFNYMTGGFHYHPDQCMMTSSLTLPTVLVSSADNLCKHFGPRSGPDSNPEGIFLKKLILKKISRRQNTRKITQ